VWRQDFAAVVQRMEAQQARIEELEDTVQALLCCYQVRG
jgi:hypothetical protein